MSLEIFDTVLGFAAVMLVLSLFVTAMVQLAAAVTNLRSRNLAWGLERLLTVMDQHNALGGRAGELAKAIVYAMPQLSSSAVAANPGTQAGGSGADAIQPAELVQALRLLARQNDNLGNAVQALIKSLGADTATSGLAQQAGQMTDQLVKLFPAQADAVKDAVQRGLLQADALSLHTAQWFDTVMSRCSQRFAEFSRWLAVLIALPLVVVMGVDAVHVYDTLRSQPAVRQSFVAMAPALEKRYEKVAEQACQHHASVALQTMADTAEQALQQAADKAADKAGPKAGSDSELAKRAKTLRSAPAKLDTEAEGLQWLADKQLSALDADFKASLAAVPTVCLQRAEKQLRDLAANELRALQPVTVPFKDLGLKHLPGLLLSWVLLTLGAPFWFNTLKTLSSLRPLVAGRADKPAS